MSTSATSGLEHLYAAKAAEELVLADRELPGSERAGWDGDPMGEIMLVKGLPGPAEQTGGSALSGPDGNAAQAALIAMGFDPLRAFKTLSRPTEGDPGSIARRLRLQLEAVDPRYVIALDRTAGADVAAALGERMPQPGRPEELRGHRVLVVDGLEASLADERSKRRVWNQLRRLEPDPPVW